MRPNRKSAPDGDLLAHCVPGRSRADKNMLGMPSIFPGLSKSSGSLVQYIHLLAVLSVGDRRSGAIPKAPTKLKYIVVAMDYFTKWIEAESLACIMGRQMIKFLWKNIMTRFGTPKMLVSDNGLQFAENPFKEWRASKGINQRFTSVAHPQTNG